MYKFNRIYRLLVGKEGSRGVEIKPPFQIEFEIEKDTKPEPNIHRLKLYNLAPETIEAVSKPDGFCVVYAGHTEDEGGNLCKTSRYGCRSRRSSAANVNAGNPRGTDISDRQASE